MRLHIANSIEKGEKKKLRNRINKVGIDLHMHHRFRFFSDHTNARNGITSQESFRCCSAQIVIIDVLRNVVTFSIQRVNFPGFHAYAERNNEKNYFQLGKFVGQGSVCIIIYDNKSETQLPKYPPTMEQFPFFFSITNFAAAFGCNCMEEWRSEKSFHAYAASELPFFFSSSFLCSYSAFATSIKAEICRKCVMFQSKAWFKLLITLVAASRVINLLGMHLMEFV